MIQNTDVLDNKIYCQTQNTPFLLEQNYTIKHWIDILKCKLLLWIHQNFQIRANGACLEKIKEFIRPYLETPSLKAPKVLHCRHGDYFLLYFLFQIWMSLLHWSFSSIKHYVYVKLNFGMKTTLLFFHRTKSLEEASRVTCMLNGLGCVCMQWVRHNRFPQTPRLQFLGKRKIMYLPKC